MMGMGAIGALGTLGLLPPPAGGGSGPVTGHLTNDAGTSVLTDDAGTNRLTPG